MDRISNNSKQSDNKIINNKLIYEYLIDTNIIL